jgi:hypothetical protein
MRSNLFALTVGLAATTSAFDCSGHYFNFFNRPGDALSYQRLDPALFPGTDSPHLHSFDGGNGLSSSTNFADTQASTCTTARVKTDKSLYWRPSLFFNNGTGFYRVPEKSTKIYYKSGDGDKWANVTGFPEDFNMIAGDPSKRSDGDNPAGVRWACHEPDGSSNPIFANGFPKGFSSCNYGFATEVTFPSCWNGEKLDPKNPNAHMAYPNGSAGVGIEICPTTHRAARFPTIFIEFWYDVSSFSGQFGPNDTPWALSNGDPTGYGFHADFLNGWEKGVLEKATGETGGCNCGCGCGQTEMEQCFGAENVNNDSDADWASCAVMGTESSDASPVLEKLPGCNPLQYGPAKATVVTGAGCDATAAPAPTGDKSSAAASSYGASSNSAAASSYAAGVTSAAPSATITSPAETSGKATLPSISLDLPSKAIDTEYDSTQPSSAAATPKASETAPSSGYDAAKPTPAAPSSSKAPTDTLPTLSLASSAAPTDVTASASPSSPADEECPAPAYVTVTPTIYVTMGAIADTTSCGGQTLTQTVTETATITVPGIGGIQYGSY